MKRTTGYRFRDNLPHRIMEVATLYGAAATIQYRRDHGIGRPEALIINTIGHHGPLTAAEVVREARVDKALVSRGINNLVAKKFVTCNGNAADRRRKIVRLTRKGEHAFRANVRASHARYRAWLDGVSEEELQVFENILARLRDNATARLSVDRGDTARAARMDAPRRAG